MTFSEILPLFLLLSLKNFAITSITTAIRIISIRKMIVFENSFWIKKWLSKNSHPNEKFHYFKANSSLFTTIQNSILSLLMTNRTYFTYYSFNHSLVLEYVNAAVSIRFFYYKNEENFRKTIINTDGRTKILSFHITLSLMLSPKSIVQTIFPLHVLQKYNL